MTGVFGDQPDIFSVISCCCNNRGNVLRYHMGSFCRLYPEPAEMTNSAVCGDPFVTAVKKKIQKALDKLALDNYNGTMG